jgi:hypothetical protein
MSSAEVALNKVAEQKEYWLLLFHVHRLNLAYVFSIVDNLAHI